MLRCTICCGCYAKMYILLLLLWTRSGAPMFQCTIRCRCFGFEVVPSFQAERFFAVALVLKWCSISSVCDLLPLLWSRSGAPMLRCTICCRCFGIPEWCPNAKMYKLLPVLWSRSGGPMLTCTVCCRCFGLAKIYDLLPLLCRSGAPMLRCTICCRCFGLEAVPQCQDARFNAQDVRFGAVAFVSKWCRNARMYNLLLLWSRSGVPFPECEMNDWLLLLWFRSGAPMQRRTICRRCFGLQC